jgi:hypothetical protein
MKLRSLTVPVALACFSIALADTEPDKAKLRGEDSKSLKVMIRTVDDGEILWAGNYTLGTKAEVAPGLHKINVMCEFRFSWGTKIMPGDIALDFEAGKTYDLVGTASADDKRCEVKANIRS